LRPRNDVAFEASDIFGSSDDFLNHLVLPIFSFSRNSRHFFPPFEFRVIFSSIRISRAFVPTNLHLFGLEPFVAVFQS
jgi:hypothetical protein